MVDHTTVTDEHSDVPAQRHLLFTCRRESVPLGVSFHNDRRVMVYRHEDGTIRATKNQCRHEGGQFSNVSGCQAICARHGWCLDLSMMTYVKPAGTIAQDELLIEEHGDDLCFYEETHPVWHPVPQMKQPLRAGEFTMRFYAHACAEFLCGGARLFTDPWLVGPAFVRGWWLAHRPPDDWLERLSAADVIYVSHNHSDHLNTHTLRRLASINPDVPIVVPDYVGGSCTRLLREAGMRVIRPVPFMTWMPLGQHGRFMILPDVAQRDDSGILIEYRGHRALNTVDCHNLCGGVLPRAELLLTSFAGGASGYPVCWEQYSEEWITRYLKKQRANELARVMDMVKKVQPHTYVPFAGYFVEAHPSDAHIRRLNEKNTAEETCAAIHKVANGISTWIPSPGSVFDIGLMQPSQETATPLTATAALHQFDVYLDEVRESLAFAPLDNYDGLFRYFLWTGYRGNCVIHVIETDENFETVLREFYFDFHDQAIRDDRPQRQHRYLRMRCRADVFRHVLRYGLPWEDISIGFQARYFRDPDTYDIEFWDHFQNRLPQQPVQWAEEPNACPTRQAVRPGLDQRAGFP